MMKSDVYGRSGSGTMSRRAFYAVMGVVLVFGFWVTSIVAGYTADWQPSLWELLGAVVIPFVGIFLSRSGSAAVSFVGFMLVALPLGALLGPVLTMYEFSRPGIVRGAAEATALTAAFMAVTGIVFPNFYRSIGGVLFGALLAGLGLLILSLFIPAIVEYSLVQYAFATLFALYIGWDMHRASEIPATLDNAVDVCVSLYLDILNLFLWILRIMQK